MADTEAYNLTAEELQERLRVMVEHAELGADCAKFKRGRVYAYLLTSATEEAARAVLALRKCPPTDHAQIAALQIQAARADDFMGWLNRAVERGEAAHDALAAVEAVS